MPPRSIFKVHKASYQREGKSLFKDLSFTIHEGELLLVRGANGSGKSTLLHLIYGLLPSQAVHWMRIGDNYAPISLFIGHHDGLTPPLSVEQNLLFRAELWNLPPAIVLDTITHCQLHEWRHQATETLSAGQRQKVALASLTMCHHSKLWILDEPDQNLDNQEQQWLHHLLKRHRAKGGALLIASHHTIPLPNFTEIYLS